MKKIDKGEFGYIYDQKKKYIIKLIVYFLIAVAIFVIGLLLNKYDKANIFTVIAIMAVLPWARALVGLIVLIPYKNVSEERYEKVKSVIKENQILYTDMVITSPEKSMHLDFIVKGEGVLIGLVGKKNQDLSYIQSYLTKGCRNWADSYTIKIYPAEQEKNFIRAIIEMKEHEVIEQEEEDLKAYLRSLIV